MMAIQYISEAQDKWRSIFSCLSGNPTHSASDDEACDCNPRAAPYEADPASPIAISEGVELFACSMASPRQDSHELEVEIFSHPNSDDEADTEGYCSGDDEYDTSHSMNTSSSDNELAFDPTLSSGTIELKPPRVEQMEAQEAKKNCPEIRVERPQGQRIERFLALEEETDSLIHAFTANTSTNSTSPNSPSLSDDDSEDELDDPVEATTVEMTAESNEDSAEPVEELPSPFYDAPFPTETELDAFDSAVRSKSALGDNPHVDKYVTMGAFILLVRAQIDVDHYKDFVCSAFLISWFQLEESFALPDRLEETHTSDEFVQIHCRMWTLVNNMKWRSFLDQPQLESAATLFRDYPHILRPRINPPKSF